MAFCLNCTATGFKYLCICTYLERWKEFLLTVFWCVCVKLEVNQHVVDFYGVILKSSTYQSKHICIVPVLCVMNGWGMYKNFCFFYFFASHIRQWTEILESCTYLQDISAVWGGPVNCSISHVPCWTLAVISRRYVSVCVWDRSETEAVEQGSGWLWSCVGHWTQES